MVTRFINWSSNIWLTNPEGFLIGQAFGFAHQWSLVRGVGLVEWVLKKIVGLFFFRLLEYSLGFVAWVTHVPSRNSSCKCLITLKEVFDQLQIYQRLIVVLLIIEWCNHNNLDVSSIHVLMWYLNPCWLFNVMGFELNLSFLGGREQNARFFLKFGMPSS